MRTFNYILLATLFLGVNSCKQSDPIQKEYKLVWSDEFDGTEVDEDKWEFMLGDGSQYGIWGWGNNEEQYYQKENATVSNGKLLIAARKEEAGGYNYTSARLRSENKGDFKYGKVEASIRMANTGGLWHAFWMLPSNPTESWPISGEIDIMEYVGNAPEEILNTIHFADGLGNHQYIGAPVPFFDDKQFHKYSVEWDENEIVWYLDDEETFKVLRTNSAISSTWPFDSEFHILLNTAVGGNLGGGIDGNALNTPKYMEVDYVRVYQK